MATVRDRLDPSIFRLPVDKLRSGYYTDQYFNLTRDLLEAEGRRPQVLMQVFQKEDSVLGGVDEAVGNLREWAGRREPGGGFAPGRDDLGVGALHEGAGLEPHETVMTIEG